MSNSTVYDVKLVYSLQDSASAGLRGIAGSAREAAASTDIFGSSMGKIVAAAGAYAGLHQMKETFFDFNRELEDANIQIATMVRANGLFDTFSGARSAAAGMLEDFKQFAIVSPLTTMEINKFAVGITTAVSQAGGSVKDITKVAEQGALVAKSFGMNADMASLQISEALQRGAHQREIFTKNLLGTIHMTTDEFNKLDAGGRLAALQKALNSPAMKESADAFGKSASGALSTFEDLYQLTAGAAGKEVFGAITAEIRSWNSWLMKNEGKVGEIKKAVSEGLVGAFDAVKSAVVFMVEHSGEIKLLVEALLLLKGVGILGSAISGGIGMLGSTIATLGTASMSSVTGLTAMAGAASNVVVGLGLLYIGLQALAEMIDKEHKREVTLEGDRGALYESLTKSKSEAVARDLAITKAKEFGAIGEGGKLNQDKFYAGLFGQGYRQQDPEVATIMKIVKGAWDPDEASRRAGLARVAPPAETEKKRTAAEVKKGPTTVNLTIQRMEVRSDDPDRFSMALVDMGERAAARPTQSLTARRF